MNQAPADDPIVSCSALDIDFADSGAKKECRKAEISSNTWIGVRQSIVARGPGYVLVFLRREAESAELDRLDLLNSYALVGQSSAAISDTAEAGISNLAERKMPGSEVAVFQRYCT